MSNYKIKSVGYNFIMNFILTASNFIFPLITFPYVSRVLQVEGNGKVAFVASIVSYFVLFASLGIPTYGVRACSKVRDDADKLSKVFQEIFMINLVCMSVVLVAYFVMIVFVPQFAVYKQLLYINAIGIVLNVFGVNWLFQALEQYQYITIRTLVFKVLSLILMFLLVHVPEDYIVYGAITVFAGVGANVFNFIKTTKLIRWKRYEHYEFRPHFKPIIILFTQSLVISIYTNLDTVMLEMMRGTYEVGLYNAATKTKGILVSLATSLGSVLLPRMSYHVESGDTAAFERLVVKALNFNLAISISIAGVAGLMSREVILFLAGDQYLSATMAMAFVTIAVIPMAVSGVLGVHILTPLNHEKYVLHSVVAGALINVVLNIVFIPQYGAVGAAFATLLAETTVVLVQVWYTRELLWKLRKQIAYIHYIVAAMMAMGAIYLLKSISLPLFFQLAVSGMVYYVIFGMILLVFKNTVVMDILVKLKVIKVS